ncbi:MAG: nuclear transport factor 2 family protein [Burkholderiales bacterium]|nr:nuclear transport factor 2 family protein [Burkholderiales bacterium]
MSTPTREDLIELVYREARLIDEKRFDEWYALFSEDGVYWVPLSPEQPDGIDNASLAYEDKLLLRLRIERLGSPRAFSQQPPSRCLHVLQRPEVEEMDPERNRYVTRTAYLYVESRGEAQQLYGCTARHTLAVIDDALRIRVKRVDLLNSGAALPSIQLFP